MIMLDEQVAFVRLNQVSDFIPKSSLPSQNVHEYKAAGGTLRSHREMHNNRTKKFATFVQVHEADKLETQTPEIHP